MKLSKSLIIFFLFIGMAFFNGCSGKPPADIGMKDGRFAPCPESPNCVSSMAEDTGHYVSPLAYQGERKRAAAVLKGVLAEFGNAVVREEREDYLWVEFQSSIMGFIDDVEFYFPENQSVVQTRSASRLGYSDLGVNRKRVERIRLLFAKRFKTP